MLSLFPPSFFFFIFSFIHAPSLPLSSHEFCIFYCLSSINCLPSFAVVASHFWHVPGCGALPFSVSSVALSLVLPAGGLIPPLGLSSPAPSPLAGRGPGSSPASSVVLSLSRWSSLVPLMSACRAVLTTGHQSVLWAIVDIGPHVCCHSLRLSPSCFFK